MSTAGASEVEPVLDDEPALNLLTLEDDCIEKILEWCSLADIAAMAGTCRTLKLCAESGALWKGLLESVWRVPPDQTPVMTSAKAAFAERFRQYKRISDLRLDTTDGEWLKEVHMASGQIEVQYTGDASDAHSDHSVGCATARASNYGSEHSYAWPVGDGESVRYYEIKVTDAGAHGYIAVGWARDDYPRRCRQPGWSGRTRARAHGIESP